MQTAMHGVSWLIRLLLPVFRWERKADHVTAPFRRS
jgi:hypothetical protein